MKTIKTAINENKKKLLFDRCTENTRPTDPSIFCPICGAQKQEFISPLHDQAHVIVLDCPCERKLKMLQNVLDENLGIYGPEFAFWKKTGKINASNQEKAQLEKHFIFLMKLRDEINQARRSQT